MTIARPATPPRGWNSWNAYRTAIDEETIARNATLMVELGLLDAGYTHLVIDDGWQAAQRDTDGGLLPDPRRFGQGMAELADHVHGLGLRFGLYASPGRQTCAMLYDAYPGVALGSFEHEQQDLDAFVAWGVDFLKYDWCEASLGTGLSYQDAFAHMARLIREAPREIVYSISEYGRTNPWEWAADVASMWRTTGDIEATFDSMASIAERMADLGRFSRPGAWNDPDMLHVGNGDFDGSAGGLAANRTHLTLWAMMAAPLFIGTELSALPPDVVSLLSNPSVLAVQADRLGRAGRRVATCPWGDVWEREQADGWAVAVAAVRDSVDVRIDGGALWQHDHPLRLPVVDHWTDAWTGERFTEGAVGKRDALLLVGHH